MPEALLSIRNCSTAKELMGCYPWYSAKILLFLFFVMAEEYCTPGCLYNSNGCRLLHPSTPHPHLLPADILALSCHLFPQKLSLQFSSSLMLIKIPLENNGVPKEMETHMEYLIPLQ